MHMYASELHLRKFGFDHQHTFAQHLGIGKRSSYKGSFPLREYECTPSNTSWLVGWLFWV